MYVELKAKDIPPIRQRSMNHVLKDAAHFSSQIYAFSSRGKLGLSEVVLIGEFLVGMGLPICQERKETDCMDDIRNPAASPGYSQ